MSGFDVEVARRWGLKNPHASGGRLLAACDEIERLRAENEMQRAQALRADEWQDFAEAAEARLAVAVEALREIDKLERSSGYRSLPEAPVDFARIARAALTKIDAQSMSEAVGKRGEG